MKHAVKHIHFIGIGGVGMCGIAEVLLNLGYSVSGSDLADNVVTQRLSAGVVHAGGCCTSRVDIDPSTRDFNGSCVMFRHGGAVDFATEYLKAASTGSRHDLPEMKKPAVTRVTDRPLHFLAVRAHGPQG